MQLNAEYCVPPKSPDEVRTGHRRRRDEVRPGPAARHARVRGAADERAADDVADRRRVALPRATRRAWPTRACWASAPTSCSTAPMPRPSRILGSLGRLLRGAHARPGLLARPAHLEPVPRTRGQVLDRAQGHGHVPRPRCARRYDARDGHRQPRPLRRHHHGRGARQDAPRRGADVRGAHRGRLRGGVRLVPARRAPGGLERSMPGCEPPSTARSSRTARSARRIVVPGPTGCRRSSPSRRPSCRLEAGPLRASRTARPTAGCGCRWCAATSCREHQADLPGRAARGPARGTQGRRSQAPARIDPGRQAVDDLLASTTTSCPDLGRPGRGHDPPLSRHRLPHRLVHAVVERAGIVSVMHILRAIALDRVRARRAGLRLRRHPRRRERHAPAADAARGRRGTLPQWTISKYFIRDPIKRQAAIDDLCRLGYAEVVKTRTKGRDRLGAAVACPRA